MNRTVIVTGGSSGIGKAVAERFMLDGDRVLVIGRDEERLAAMKNLHGDTCETYRVDVSGEKDVRDFFAAIDGQQQGRAIVDVLVNAAGFAKAVSTRMDIGRSISNWNDVVSTNLTGAFLMAVHAAPLLRRPGGRIINISSIGAFSGGSSGGAIGYAASKAGLNGMTFGFARELSGEGITVNSIAPGFVEDTGFTSVYPKEQVDRIVEGVPAGRPGRVDDVAEACFFLASEKASYITGEVLNVNGGWLFGR